MLESEGVEIHITVVECGFDGSSGCCVGTQRGYPDNDGTVLVEYKPSVNLHSPFDFHGKSKKLPLDQHNCMGLY